MKIYIAFLLSLFFFDQLSAQDSWHRIAFDSRLISNVDLDHFSVGDYRKRQKLVAAASIAAYGGSLVALNKAWYSNYPKASFHSFDDSREWLQMDKVGHAWSVYNLSRVSTAAWKWAGLNEKKAVVIGSASGFAYLTVIELLDAHSEKWGWSWADMGANLTGSGLFAAQQLTWGEQRIQFKFSAHKKSYSQDLLLRADDLFGKSTPERFLKDYNGQTYWLSINAKSFLLNIHLPAWLNLSIGYGADGLFGGYDNIGYDKNGNVIFNRPDIKRRRQWYLSPDIDFTKIKTGSKTVRTLLSALNAIKIPAPAIELSNGKLKGHWLYF